MPTLKGKSIVSMGLGSRQQYTLGTTSSTVTISTPGDRIMVRYSESGVNCGNYGDAIIELGEDRASISGKVACIAPGVHPRDRENAAISGWFDLDK